MAARPSRVWKRSASPRAMIAGSSRWPKLSNVLDRPTEPGYALTMLGQIRDCALWFT